MSYINFSYTQHSTLPTDARATTQVEAGFSREGGRLEYVTHTVQAGPTAAPRVVQVLPGVEVTAAADAVRDAIQGANWVQDVTVDLAGRGTPGQASWTFRHGGSGTAALDAVPAPIQAVIDAAERLEAVSAVTPKYV